MWNVSIPYDSEFLVAETIVINVSTTALSKRKLILIKYEKMKAMLIS